MSDCIFCKIAAGQIPSRSLYEDDEIIAFHDIHPHAPMHFLVVPKQQIATMSEVDSRHAALLGKMMVLAAKLAGEQGCAVRLDETGKTAGGFKLLFNTGPDGGQEVYHLHLHVIGGPHPWTSKH